MTTNDTLVNDADDLDGGGTEYYGLGILIVAILFLGALALGSSVYLRRFRRHEGRGLQPRNDTDTYTGYGRRAPSGDVRTLTGSLSGLGADSLPPSYPDLPPSYEDACKTRLGLDNMGFCAMPELPLPPPYEAAASNVSHPSTSTLVHTTTSQPHVHTTSTLVHTTAQTEPYHAQTSPQTSTDLPSEPNSSRSESHTSHNPPNSDENLGGVDVQSPRPKNDGTIISAASLNQASSDSQLELTSGAFALTRLPESNSETGAEEQCGFYV